MIDVLVEHEPTCMVALVETVCVGIWVDTVGMWMHHVVGPVGNTILSTFSGIVVKGCEFG